MVMRIGIVGWGIEGQSAFHYFGPQHDYLIVNEEPRNDFPVQSDKVVVRFINQPRQPGITSNVKDLTYLEGLKECDKIVYSPTTIKNLQAVYKDDKDFWNKATSALRIFFKEVNTKNIIGVTGTKGKGTTCTLIAKMLEAAGQKVWLGGNIGKSVFGFLNDVQPTDWVVLELSNFQLYDFPYSPHIAVCLMIAPEHLDWHADVDEYAKTKANIFAHQNKNDIAIYLDDDLRVEEIAGLSPGKKISFMGNDGAHIRADGMIVIGENETEIIQKTKVRLLGEHNLQNICAALTAFWQVSQNVEAVKHILTTFKGLEHRLEFVRELYEVQYYDDSFGTSPETAIVALRSFIQPVVMILGGSDKGADYQALAEEIAKRRVRKVIAIGQTGPKIIAALKKAGFKDVVVGPKTMPEIVKVAKEVAEAGDVVLLSPASASFDLFKDYKDRGNKFNSAVRALA
ncbi:UDP-N-acetylmuramoyl-L-alanine--D-glutamate ligase [Candidatus Saccharibacteria bacterium]|nr:UDP-N-acetylmuramoyl-L-alanine--D-glutamate ligase [Candidatus Saccharibacteria bacterium]